jgi:type 2 lantibiotic biosynthesis protein LanM
MELSALDDPVWFNAMTLGERAGSLRAAPSGALSAGAFAAVDEELAEMRIRRWRSSPPFDNQDLFDRRLATDSIDERQLRCLLGETVDSLRRRISDPPAWVEKVGIAFSGTANAPKINRERPGPEQLQKLGFLVGLEPLIRLGLQRLRANIKSLEHRHPYVPFDGATAEQLMIAGLPQQLIKVVARTMVLELNIARLQGLLRGDTAEARYLSFLELIAEPAVMLSVLREYPVLARQVVASIDNWVETSVEFLTRLSDDWYEICASLNGGADPGKLSHVAPGAGDLHRGGRSVIISTFGDAWKLVYKPHSLAVDVHFRQLLATLNQWGDHPPFRAPVAIDRGDYGWSEFVVPHACDSRDEVQRFYERQGGYLALLYSLEATDFHLENLIASGEHPVLVDLEALFHPRLGLFGGSGPLSNHAAEDVMARSVLRVGLLPQRIWASDGRNGIDISGLGGEPGQLSPHLVPMFDGAGTDEMKVVRKQVPMPGSHNRPSVDGALVNPQDFVGSLLKGFTSIYKLIVRRRCELLAENGPIAAFAGDEVRVVLRPTRTYALLLSEGSHPDVLRQGFERDRLFDQLWRDIEARPKLAELVPAESADLLRGDVPVFTTRPDSTELCTSRGERFAGFFQNSSLAMVKQRLAEAGDNDLSRQTWMIRASMASMTVGHNQSAGAAGATPSNLPIASPDDFLAAARSVGDKLELLAIEQNDDVAWIGLVLMDGNSWSLLPLSFDLYGGTLGIILFLAYLGSITGQDRYSSLARRALAPVLIQVDVAQRSAPRAAAGANIGAFAGWGGVIYTLAHIGSLWSEPDLVSRAEATIEHIGAQIEKDRALDVIGGSAGLIPVLCGFYRSTGFEPARKLAADCAEHLISMARPMETGIAWDTPVAATRPLTGFSHGAAGFAWALQEIASLTGEQRFTKASLDAVAYERSVFSPQAANWPDFRSDVSAARTGPANSPAGPNSPAYSMTWCHGAPGIALGRLMLLQYRDDPSIRAEAEIALETTVRGGFGMNHSLCHGDLGNLEPILIASQSLPDARWRSYAAAISSSVLQRINSGWVCGVPQGVETPGLLVGLAGIGYGLLRLADPSRVPSVLALAPPPKSDA